jgi:hypothetical protein
MTRAATIWSVLGLVVILAISLILSACSRTNPSLVEQAPAYQPSPPPPQVKLPGVVAPRLAEVQDAVKRVFKNSAIVDTQHNPSFFAGDFNGDLSQDIAIIVKPAPGKVSEMNEQYPPWLLRDPFANPNERQQFQVEQDEEMLAVIHGYGTNDWRDPEATQTYLLKNSVGSGIRVHTGPEFINANSGRKVPQLQGDLIGEMVRGTQGYIYYSGASYRWYDPKTFRGDSVKGMVHPIRTASK